MEALWNLEDKWKLSTQKAALVLACTCVLVISIGVVVALLRKKRTMHQELAYKRWDSVKKALMGSVRWSEPSKWEESERPGSERETPTPLLVTRDPWQSHNSSSAVWQRPILMGEKCELPRFSGLILYDQKGKPLHDCHEDADITIDIQVLLIPYNITAL